MIRLHGSVPLAESQIFSSPTQYLATSFISWQHTTQKAALKMSITAPVFDKSEPKAAKWVFSFGGEERH